MAKGGTTGKDTGKSAKAPPKPRKAPAAAAKKPAAAPKPPPPPPQPDPKPESVAGFSTGPDIASLLTEEQRRMMETLSANLARAAVTAQGAIAEAALRQADRPAALSPDPFHVGPALNEVIGSLAAQIGRASCRERVLACV